MYIARISYAIYIWVIPPFQVCVLNDDHLVSPVGWKWLWQCYHSHHMWLRKWLWSFRDRLFSRFQLAPAIFVSFVGFLGMKSNRKVKLKNRNSKTKTCKLWQVSMFENHKKMNYINLTTKKIAFLWFPRCSFLLFNLIRMSNLKFPGEFPVWVGFFRFFFPPRKKNIFFVRRVDDKNDEENWTELLSCTLQVDIHQIQPAEKKCRSQPPSSWVPGFQAPIRQDFFGRKACWNMPFEEKKKTGTSFKDFQTHFHCTKNHGISTCGGLESQTLI